MELFHKNGHLTDEALTALICQDTLDELQRLKISEHLAFCDRCLQRYTELLSESPLMEPSRSCRSSLWRRIRQRTVRLFSNRYATAAAAVALALTLLWGGEQFTLAPILNQAETIITEATPTWPERWDAALSTLSGHLRGMFDSIDIPVFPGGDRAP